MAFRSDPILSPPALFTPPLKPSNSNYTSSSTRRRTDSDYKPYNYNASAPTPTPTTPRVTSIPPPPPSSVGLSCLSPDSLSFHSLVLNEGTIVTHFLPLSKPNDNDRETTSYNYNNSDTALVVSSGSTTSNNGRRIDSIRTALPAYIVSLLSVDAPLELLCIDNDTPAATFRSDSSVRSSTNSDDTDSMRRRKLPSLALYTPKSAFLLDISYPCNNNNNEPNDTIHHNNPNNNSGNVVTGRIDNLHEPFESHLDDNNNTNGDDYDHDQPTSILRIRPAPNSHLHGGGVYGSLCPRGAMIMLTNRGDLVLYHGQPPQSQSNSTSATTSSSNTIITFHREDIQEPDPIVDFTFLPSAASSSNHNHNSIWNTMAVVLSSKAGTLHVASPIVFHGTLIPRATVIEGVGYFHDVLGRERVGAGGGADARCREAKAALHFFKDVFGISSASDPSSSSVGNNGANGYYVMANMLNDSNTRNTRCASGWPVSLQGPVYVHDNEGVLDGGDPSDYNNNNNSYVAIGVTCIEILPPPPPNQQQRQRRTRRRNQQQPNNNNNDDEPFDHEESTGSTTGVLLARGSTSLDYIFIPTGDNVLPRFAFESVEDSDQLNSVLDNSGVLVERVVFDDDAGGSGGGSGVDVDGACKELMEERALIPFGHGSNVGGGRQVGLILDPVDKAMVHHVSGRGVIAVTSNVAIVVEQKLRGIIQEDLSTSVVGTNSTTRRQLDRHQHEQQQQQQQEVEIKTNAWSSIEVGGAGATTPGLNGVVVSGDAQLGHILIAFLSNGKTEAVNITAAQYIRESGNLITAEAERLSLVESSLQGSNSNNVVDTDEALKTIESIPPLYKLISPLFEQISTGLSGMGKIVGEPATMPRDVTPGQVATFLAMKQQCEQDVVFPLQRLKDVVETRQEFLREMQQHQLLQITQLKTMLDTLRERKKVTDEKKTVLSSNSEQLSQRSASVLAAARDLKPTLTTAEQEYFKELRRYEACCIKWEDAVKTLQSNSDRLRENIATGEVRCSTRLDPNQMEQCQSLLKGQDTVLRRNDLAVQEMEGTVTKLLISSGLGDEEGRKPLALLSDDENKSGG